MKTLRFLKSIPMVTVYEGEGDAAAAAAAKATADAAAAAAAAAGGGAGDDLPVTNQDQLNTVLKREKEKFRAANDKLIKQLEAVQNDSRTSAETKAMLETQLEEMRRQNMSTEERARLEKEKLQKDHTQKLEAATQEGQTWRGRHDNLQIGYDISTGAQQHEVIGSGVQFLEAYLRPRTKLVERLDSENRPTGKYDTKATLIIQKDGKPVEVEYNVGDAIKQMKDMPEDFGFLFKSSAAAGLGAGTGTPGKKPNVATMSPEAYMEARKKNPAALGLK